MLARYNLEFGYGLGYARFAKITRDRRQLVQQTIKTQDIFLPSMVKLRALVKSGSADVRICGCVRIRAGISVSARIRVRDGVRISNRVRTG